MLPFSVLFLSRLQYGEDWIGELVCILSGGDITRRDRILWGYTYKECVPYIRHRQRELTLREVMLALLGVKDKKAGKETDAEYQESMKKAIEQFNKVAESKE